MNKKLAIFALILFIVIRQDINGQSPSPYLPGEKANYIIHYGLINGGVARMELASTKFEGRDVLHSYFIAYTTGVADVIFKVRDIYESLFNPVTELPMKSIRNIHEGRYRKYNVVYFDHNSRTDSAIISSDLTGKHITVKGIHDILSCFYYFRKNYLAKNYPFKAGEVVTINTWFTDEFFPVILRYAGTENVRTRLGRIKCYKFNPVTEVGRLFKTQDDVSIWFSADKNGIPIKVRFDIFVGAFTAEITSFEGLVEPLVFIK